jgi:hypothetical protein
MITRSEWQILVSVPVSAETFGLNHNRSFGLVFAVISVSAEISVQNTTENCNLKFFLINIFIKLPKYKK